jgi:hypothetical protein
MREDRHVYQGTYVPRSPKIVFLVPTLCVGTNVPTLCVVVFGSSTRHDEIVLGVCF